MTPKQYRQDCVTRHPLWPQAPLSPINRHRPLGFRRRLSPPRIERRTDQHPPGNSERRRRTIEHHPHLVHVMRRRVGTGGPDNGQPHPRRAFQTPQRNRLHTSSYDDRPTPRNAKAPNAPTTNTKPTPNSTHRRHRAPPPACHHPRTIGRAAQACPFIASNGPDPPRPHPPPRAQPNPPQKPEKAPHRTVRGLSGPRKTGKVRPGCCGPDLSDQTVKPIDTTRYSLLLSGRCGRFSPACAAFHS